MIIYLNLWHISGIMIHKTLSEYSIFTFHELLCLFYVYVYNKWDARRQRELLNKHSKLMALGQGHMTISLGSEQTFQL